MRQSQTPGNKTPKKRLFADRLARRVVQLSGLAIIVSVLGILVFILLEVWPLLARPRVMLRHEAAMPGARFGAVLTDEHRTASVGITADGRVVALRNGDDKVLQTLDLSAALLEMKAFPERHLLAASTADGRVVLVPVEFTVSFSGNDKRAVQPVVGPSFWLTLDPQGRPVRHFAAQMDREGGALAAAQLEDGTLAVVRRTAEVNEITGEKTESLDRHEAPSPYRLTALSVDDDQRNLYGGGQEGQLLWWSLQDGAPAELRTTAADLSPITALSLLIGDRSLVVGQADGSISVWFPVRQGDGFRLTRVRDFPRHPGAILGLAPSPRDKGFLALDVSGRLGLYYSTSHRTLWAGRAPLRGAVSVAFAPKGDGASLSGPERIAELDIFNPHPEVTWRAMFGKVWYEGYDEPKYVWQSTGGTDDFEPKLSLTPLVVGTLKGTFYSLLLAIPLGVFGAMYTSQFMHPGYTRYLKPMIEIMASLPSVVLGFLAGLWLAPRLEGAIPALLLMTVVLPLLILAAGYCWNAVPRALRGRFHFGFEAIPFILVLAAGIWLCFQLAKPFEKLAFGGNFQAWLLQATGLSFDQRNAVVVGLAMGFAVIPIIFAIAEDAFSNVPKNLAAGSLALGANRWQTVTRVVLPTASPGIFSAIMVGFGRAVGETMIVLMATGNTPIMDWNPFNGFRTLSANIAVEIPEAPHGGTLYRMLFLAALLLFIMTFAVNTIAELVRQRLRERYSHL